MTPLHILVAEDNEFNTRHLERLLVRRGHSVRLADNGREALALLGVEDQASGVPVENRKPGRTVPPCFAYSKPCPPTPDSTCCSWTSTCRSSTASRSSGDPRTGAGHGGPSARHRLDGPLATEDREHCLAAGMDEYLAKPIRAVDLFAAIDRVVSAHGGPRPATDA